MVALVNPSTSSDEHELLRQTVRQFVQNRVEPQAMEHDESAKLPRAPRVCKFVRMDAPRFIAAV